MIHPSSVRPASFFIKIATAFTLLGGVAAWPLAANAQRLQNQSHQDFACYYFGNIKRPQDVCNFMGFKSNNHAEEVVDRILKPVGLARNFVVVECPNTDNCFATVVEGKRYIIYDGKFMRKIEDLTDTDWGAVSVMAHEIGHHLQGHTIDGKGSRPSKELEADQFSGFVLHQLGATLDEALIAIRTFGNDVATGAHPAKHNRVEVIKKGWNEAEAMYPKWIKQPAAANPVVTNRRFEPNAPMAKAPTSTIGCVLGNCQDGRGVFVRENQERYEGDFQYGIKHGRGVLYYANGKVKYQGTFFEDLRVGNGTYYFPNGERYVGQFDENLPAGLGTYYFNDGDRFEGLYRDGQRNGPGVLIRKNGRREEGYYEDDEKLR